MIFNMLKNNLIRNPLAEVETVLETPKAILAIPHGSLMCRLRRAIPVAS